LSFPADIQALQNQLDAAERDAAALISGLTEDLAGWRAKPNSWCVAECLDHLAITNRVYLTAMQAPALEARRQGRFRTQPVLPGKIAAVFVRLLEPPPRARMKAPRKIQPRPQPPLAEAVANFLAAQNEVRAFLEAQSDLELAKVRFPNPFLPGVRFSLATGLHVICAHERRHLYQASQARHAAESARNKPAPPIA